jgi:hypothetical protein
MAAVVEPEELAKSANPRKPELLMVVESVLECVVVAVFAIMVESGEWRGAGCK